MNAKSLVNQATAELEAGNVYIGDFGRDILERLFQTALHCKIWYGFKSLNEGLWLVDTNGHRAVFESREDANRAMPDYFTRGFEITPCSEPPDEYRLGGGRTS